MEELQEEQAQLKIRLNQNQTEWEKLSKKINKLKRKKLTYPSGVELLVESVQEEFAGIGRESSWSALRNSWKLRMRNGETQ